MELRRQYPRSIHVMVELVERLTATLEALDADIESAKEQLARAELLSIQDRKEQLEGTLQLLNRRRAILLENLMAAQASVGKQGT